MPNRWTRRPEGSNWGDFGADDTRGSLNYIRPQDRLRAVRSVQDGLAFCLSLPLDYPGGRVIAQHRGPPRIEATTRQGRPYFNYGLRSERAACRDVGCDDVVTLYTQYSTQWDSLAHIGHEFDLLGNGSLVKCFYNGFTAGKDIVAPADRTDGYAMPLGVNILAEAAIQARGVMLDASHHFGRGPLSLGLAEIRYMLEQDGIEPRQGDILCLHTGFADEVLHLNRNPGPDVHDLCAALDGDDQGLLNWLSDMRIAAIAADNIAVERIGAGGCAHSLVPLHHHCLFKRGLPLGELWHLTPLAAWLRHNKRFDFLLTAPPLRLPNAVGSPVTPVATV